MEMVAARDGTKRIFQEATVEDDDVLEAATKKPERYPTETYQDVGRASSTAS